MNTDDILSQIDSILDDWTVSDDAMRSRPDGYTSERPFAFGGYVPTVQIMDEVGEWQEIGGVASIEIQIEPPAIDPEFAQAWQELQERFLRHYCQAAERAGEALAAFGRAIVEASASAQEDFGHQPEAQGCNDCGPQPAPRDRPAWQSPYGPARRRR